MIRRRTLTAFTAMVWMFAAASLSARGQTPGASEGLVTGNGTTTIQRPADVLRIQVDVPGEGKDAREAIAKLREAEKAAREKLTALGASADSVKLAPPRVASVDGASQATGQRAMIERMIRARTGQGGDKAATTAPAAPSVKVVATLTAEWPLKGQSPDDRLVEAMELQGKVKAAQLVPQPAAKELTPEEQEEAEENAAMFDAMGGEGGAAPGEPVFMFVAKLSDADRAKAMAQAFADAKTDATHLAKAAAAGLGPLRQLTGTATAVTEDETDADNFMMNYVYAAMQRQRPAGSGEPTEAVGSQPGNVSYRVTVSASFALNAK
jgi:uncharacterized protein YggE